MRVGVAAVVLAGILAVAAGRARATEYEVFVDIDDEEDLYALLEDGQISDTTFTALSELLRRGINLDTASREELYSLPNLTYAEVDAILAYRQEAGFIGDPAVLVGNGILTERKLAAVAAFLVVGERQRAAWATDGKIRVPVLYAFDGEVPAVAVQARLSTYKHLTVGGVAVLARNRLGDVVWDPNRDALAADAPTTRPYLPKLYALWETPTFTAIAGSYRIGFAQRLTFDTTDRYTPDGPQLDDAIYRDSTLSRECRESPGELPDAPCDGDQYIGPDWRWREGLVGAALSVRKIPAGSGWLQLHAFGSYRPRSIYQYEIYDRARCDDPSADDDPACAAPSVFRRADDPLAATSRFSFSTLPDLFAEGLAGGNASWFAARRAHVGVTAWGADVRWLAEGADLDFQEWSRWPRGGRYGAVGVDAAYGFGDEDLFLEATRSFDAIPGGGGGLAAILRGTHTHGHQELEGSLRWYADDFVNPYAGPIAAADEVDGQRARDEAGGRIKVTTPVGESLSVRGALDVWVQPSTDTPKALAYLRGDWEASDLWRFGLWLQAQDKDLGTGGDGACFEVSTEEDENGEPIPCTGRRFTAAGRARLSPRPRTSLSAQYQHALVDDPRYPDAMRQDLQAWLSGSTWATDKLLLRARVRYLLQDTRDDAYLEESLWTYLDVAWRAGAQRAHLRWDLYWWLDGRTNTMTRSPNPENRLWLEIESRF